MAHVLYRLKAIEARYEEGQAASCYLRIAAALKKNPKQFSKVKPEAGTAPG